MFNLLGVSVLPSSSVVIEVGSWEHPFSVIEIAPM